MATKNKTQRKICRVYGCRTNWRSAIHQLCYKHRNHDEAAKRKGGQVRACTVQGCLNVVLARGLCSSHQYELYEQLEAETIQELELIFASWITVDEDKCWIWFGKKKEGYGHLIVNGRWFSMHRWFYMHLVGPIPDGHELHHECGKPACVRPGHLTPLTPEKHREITAFTAWMFSVLPTAVLGIDNLSRTDKERRFGMTYGLPVDRSVHVPDPAHVFA